MFRRSLKTNMVYLRTTNVAMQKRTLFTSLNSTTHKLRVELERRRYSSATNPIVEKTIPHIPQAEVDDFNSTLIENPKFTSNNIPLKLAITKRAATRLNQIAEKEQNKDLALRIGVESGGCHGFQYLLNLTDLSTRTEDDSVLTREGARILIDESSISILRDSKVDYTNELIGSQFKVVDSPYTSSACGCGSSFDFDFTKLEN